MDLAQLLERLVQVTGVAGHERSVAEHLQEEWAPLSNAVRIDRAGNCVAVRHGDGPAPRPAVMVTAHMDSIGFMVSKIERGGFLRLSPVGGWDRRQLVGQEVWVHGERRLTGVVGSKPPHVTPPAERRKTPNWKDLFVDVGLSEESVRRQVPLGSVVTLKNQLMPLLGERVAAGALDDRAGLAALTVALDELNRLRHACDFYAVGTTSEEFGDFNGAYTATFGLAPSIGVAVDVTHAEIAGPAPGCLPLEGGPAVLIGPNAHPKVSRLLRDIAREEGIPTQVEVEAGSSGTDAWAIQVVQAGVPSAVLSVPLRYMHSAVEVISLQDVRAAGRLLARFAARVDGAFVEGLACF